MAVKSSKHKQQAGEVAEKAPQAAPANAEKSSSSPTGKSKQTAGQIVCLLAPENGECNIALMFRGKAYNLRAVDRVVALPKFDNPAQLGEFIASLPSHEFKNTSVVDEPVKPKLKIFTLQSSEIETGVHTESLYQSSHVVDGKPAVVKFINGVGKTTYPEVKQELLNQGYILIREEEVKE